MTKKHSYRVSILLVSTIGIIAALFGDPIIAGAAFVTTYWLAGKISSLELLNPRKIAAQRVFESIELTLRNLKCLGCETEVHKVIDITDPNDFNVPWNFNVVASYSSIWFSVSMSVIDTTQVLVMGVNELTETEAKGFITAEVS